MRLRTPTENHREAVEKMNENQMKINWYPGHMTKARRMMQKELSTMDAIIHILDARIVRSSQNPDFEDMFAGKERLYILNKTDLANDESTARWIRFFKENGQHVLAVNCSNGKGINQVLPTLQQMLSAKLEKYRQKGMKKTLHVMVTGIPNVGKSTFINKLAGRKVASAQDRPGVTRAKQWVSLPGGVDLLDTPGMLWPKFEDVQTGMFLAFTGAIRDDILDRVELCFEFIKFMCAHYPEPLCERFKINEDISCVQLLEVFDLICKKRGFLISGGEYNYERAAAVILDEFRAGKIGKISFEEP